MNFFQEFRTETKLLLVVALAAAVLVVVGIWLFQATGPGSSSPIPTPSPQMVDGEEITITGIVLKNDREFLPVDGPAILSVQTQGFGVVSVLYHPGEAECENLAALEAGGEVSDGEEIEVFGKVVGSTLETCASASYYIREINLTENQEEVNRFSNWQTYRNSHFEFQYPSGWTQSIQPTGSGSIVSWQSLDNVYMLTLTTRANQFEGGKFVNSAEELYQSSVREKKSITLDGVEAIQLLPQGTQSEAAFLYQGTIYTLSFENKASDEARIQAGFDTFDQILSTFRFVEEKARIPSEDEALISSIRSNACYGHIGKCDDFVDRYIVDQQPLPSNVVEDDETLKNFLREGLNLFSSEELPLYRGIVGEEGEVGVLTYYNNIDNPVIIKITQESNLEGVLWLVPVNFFDSHGLRIFIGDMKELVANEPPFFRVSFTARVGTCVPVGGSFGLYQIGDEKALFNQLEKKVSIRTHIDNPQEGRVVESDISFEDTNGDGNMEVVQKGTEIICAEREDPNVRYSCTSCATEELTNEIEKIFIWDSTQKRFVEKILKE